MTEVGPILEMSLREFLSDKGFAAKGKYSQHTTLEGYPWGSYESNRVYVFPPGTTPQQLSEFIHERYASDDIYPHKKVEIRKSNYFYYPNHWGMQATE